jgi:hypothetical protein
VDAGERQVGRLRVAAEIPVNVPEVTPAAAGSQMMGASTPALVTANGRGPWHCIAYNLLVSDSVDKSRALARRQRTAGAPTRCR